MFNEIDFTPRKRHPFPDMEVDEVVKITENIPRMQIYAHVYGRSACKKFITRKVDGILYVKRVE